MKRILISKSPAVLGIAILLAAPISQASAYEMTTSAHLRLKTSVTEVNGVREIESGNFEKGIRKSIASLSKSSASTLRKPLLDNLCVAHIAINDLNKAQQYCDSAVNTGKPSAISYNNRAVLHYVVGNMQASAEDINVAEELANIKNITKHNGAIINQRSMISKN